MIPEGVDQWSMPPARWLVLHEIGAPSHYTGLCHALQQVGERLEFVEFNFIQQAKSLLRRRSRQQISRTLTNLARITHFAFSGARGKYVVLGLAPYNPWIIVIRWLLRNATVYLHTSWPHWDGSKQPHRPLLPGVLSLWKHFLKHEVRHVFVATETVKRNLAASCYGGASTTVVAHSVDTATFHPATRTAQPPRRLLYVGRIEPSKGIVLMLAVAQRMPDCVMTFVGSGPLSRQVEAAASRQPNVRFLGQISDRRHLADELRASDVLLLPSIRGKTWEELFGIVLIEAMACATVPITTDHVGPTEIFGEELSELVFSEADFVEGVCDKIEHWKQHPESLQRLRDACLRLASHYATDQVAGRWSNALGLKRPAGPDIAKRLSSGALDASNPNPALVAPVSNQTVVFDLSSRGGKPVMSNSTRALAWSVANALGTKGTNFVVYLLLARVLGPHVFGIVALGLATTTMIEMVCEHKFSAVLIEKPDIDQSEKSTIFWFQVICGLIFAALLVACADLLGRFFKEPQLSAILPWQALAMLVNTTTYAHEALLKRALRFKALTIRSMAANLIGGAVGVAMALAGFGVVSMVTMLVVSAVCGSAVLWLTSDWRPSLAFRWPAFIPLHRSARYMAVTGIAGAAASQANIYIVGHVFGTPVAGLYSFALRIYDVLMRVTTFSISEAAFPILARKAANLPAYRAAFTALLGTGGMLTVGLLMAVGALSPTIIPIFFGQQWSMASDYLLVYLITGALISAGAYNDVTLLAFGRRNRMAAAEFAGLIIWMAQLPLLLSLGPLFPAIAWCIKEAVMFPVKASWATSLMQMPATSYLKILAPVVGTGTIAAIAAALAQHILRDQPVVGLMVAAVIGMMSFVGVAAMMGHRLPQALLDWLKLRIKR